MQYQQRPYRPANDQAMPEIDFLSVVLLPAFRGLPLALTATRALERWSDLVDGATPPSTLKASERIDIVDECLDVVVPRVGMPVGFEFTGLSAAGLRAALRAAPGYEDEQAALDSVLRGTAVGALRDAGRKRIHRLPPRTALRQSRLWLPDGVGAGEEVVAPAVLFELLDAAQSLSTMMRRNRGTVELTSVGSTQNRRFPLRGTRYPVPVNERNTYYVVWDGCRLIPQPGVREPDYR